MKPRSLALLILLAATTFSCKKEDSVEIDATFKTTQNNGLVGKWRLVESLSDPGDGSGTWQSVALEQVQVLEFRADSSFVILSRQGKAFGTYSTSLIPRLTAQRLQMRFAGNSGSPQNWYIIGLKPTALELSLGCIEPCGNRYTAVE